MKKYILILGLVLLSTLHSAAPLFHAVLGEKWLETFEQHYDAEQKRAFLLGTLFPDIRYPANIPREKTHEKGMTFERVKNTPDPFLKGMRFHMYVDITRDKILKQWNILDQLQDYVGDRNLFLKVFEDELLYQLREENASSYLIAMQEHLEPAEIDFGIPLEIVTRWHQLNAEYFRMQPSELLARFAAANKAFGNISALSVSQISEGCKMYSENKILRSYILEMLAEFDRHFAAEK